MKAYLLPLLLLSSVASADAVTDSSAAQLTLDPARYDEALRAVRGLPQPTPSVDDASAAAEARALSSAPGVEDWQAAMRDAGTELADVRLLVLLQRLNPLTPPSARAEDYAAALRLHHLMLAGNARACLQLARACREGCFESGLVFLQSVELAAVLERRAARFQLPAKPLPATELSAPTGR